MTNTIKKSVKTVLVAILAITAIIVGSIPMETSAMIFDDVEFNSSDNAYYYDEDLCVLEVYKNIDNKTLQKYSDAYIVKFVDVKVETVSLKDCSFGYLQFERCDLTSAKVEGATNIESIYISECKMDNLEFLASANNTIDITISDSELGSVDGIENMKKIECAYFYVVGIEDITPMAELQNLRDLTLQYTCVQDISPIKNLNIEYLCVDDSVSIESFDSLIGMKSLEYFSSRNCQMAYSKDFYDFLRKDRVSHDIERKDFQLQERVKEVAKQLTRANMTDEEKVETVVQYVVDLMDYDFAALSDDDLLTLYNEEALKFAVDGEGVCRNYSALVNALLMEMDVEVFEIRNEDHIWNLVVIDDQYYWIDATWIDDEYTTDVTENMYYCTTTYYFIDHNSLTVPSTVYNKSVNIDAEDDYIVEEETTEEETTEEETEEKVENETFEETVEETEEYSETTTRVVPEKMHTRLDDDRETTIFSNINNIALSDDMDDTIIGISISAIVMAVIFIAVLVKRYTANSKRV